eukprot:SM000005S17149  [mRNA]  locus=s5:390063:395485:- [translate_table: standard]
MAYWKPSADATLGAKPLSRKGKGYSRWLVLSVWVVIFVAWVGVHFSHGPASTAIALDGQQLVSQSRGDGHAADALLELGARQAAPEFAHRLGGSRGGLRMKSDQQPLEPRHNVELDSAVRRADLPRESLPEDGAGRSMGVQEQLEHGFAAMEKDEVVSGSKAQYLTGSAPTSDKKRGDEDGEAGGSEDDGTEEEKTAGAEAGGSSEADKEDGGVRREIDEDERTEQGKGDVDEDGGNADAEDDESSTRDSPEGTTAALRVTDAREGQADEEVDNDNVGEQHVLAGEEKNDEDSETSDVRMGEESMADNSRDDSDSDSAQEADVSKEAADDRSENDKAGEVAKEQIDNGGKDVDARPEEEQGEEQEQEQETASSAEKADEAGFAEAVEATSQSEMVVDVNDNEKENSGTGKGQGDATDIKAPDNKGPDDEAADGMVDDREDSEQLDEANTGDGGQESAVARGSRDSLTSENAAEDQVGNTSDDKVAEQDSLNKTDEDQKASSAQEAGPIHEDQLPQAVTSDDPLHDNDVQNVKSSSSFVANVLNFSIASVAPVKSINPQVGGFGLPGPAEVITQEEQEELRKILAEIAAAKEDFNETDALTRFWESVDYAGKEDEEGDKGDGDGGGANENERERIEADFDKEEAEERGDKMLDGESQLDDSDDGLLAADAGGDDTGLRAEDLTGDFSRARRARGTSRGKARKPVKIRFKLPPSPPEYWPPEPAHERWTPPKKCANVEEMGAAAVGDTRAASLRIRKLIRSHLAAHGATTVRKMRGSEFCKQGFVLGKGQHDGLGNNIYKAVTAAGLAMLLNRSIIIGEHGSTMPDNVRVGRPQLPFGDYILYSQEMFSMGEVKRLWVLHDCVGRHGRELTMRIDSFAQPTRSKVLCEDWTRWVEPIIWFSDASDAVGLQWFLKSRQLNMRARAYQVMGHPWDPDSRPNVFGELLRVLIKPSPIVKQAVDWTLAGRAPDLVLHLRMLHSKSPTTLAAATSCVQTAIDSNPYLKGRRPRLVIVSDTPTTIPTMTRLLGKSAEVISFDYAGYMDMHPENNKMNADSFQVPDKRKKDWGPMPRWVALVDFFLAARARRAVISSAAWRVATTYAQLVASLAAANNLNEQGDNKGFVFWSCFNKAVLDHGLLRQGGRGHAWHTFGGPLSCPRQPAQCAMTPLLPYAWWDAPWQSLTGRDMRKLRQIGIKVTSEGVVTQGKVNGFCKLRRSAQINVVKLALPTCKALKLSQCAGPPSRTAAGTVK